MVGNTVRLIKGKKTIPNRYISSYEEGDAILGIDAEMEVIKTWRINDYIVSYDDYKAMFEEAKKELEKLSNIYNRMCELTEIVEYAIEVCNCDMDGDFVEGSDFTFCQNRIVDWAIEDAIEEVSTSILFEEDNGVIDFSNENDLTTWVNDYVMSMNDIGNFKLKFNVEELDYIINESIKEYLESY